MLTPLLSAYCVFGACTRRPPRPYCSAFTAPPLLLLDEDSAGGAEAGRFVDLLAGLRLGVDDERVALVVLVEHAGRPEVAVARRHAALAVDRDLESHRSQPTTSGLWWPQA